MARSLLVLALFLASTAAAQDEIWGPALPRRPFDAQAFLPILPPAWVRGTTGVGYTLSGMDAKGRAEAASHGVSISEVNFVDPFYPYYDSKLLKRRSPHVPIGRTAAEVAEYKRLGIRVLGVYPPCLQGEVYEAHPEWRRIDRDAIEIPSIDMEKYPHGGMLCLLGPYGDFFIDVLAEIVTTFPDVDAFSFDGLHYGGVCYCKNCRDAYRAHNGAEIPAVNMDDPAFRRYQRWADAKMEDLVRRMQTRLKAIKPTVALVTWTTNAGRWGHFLSIPRNMPSRMNLLLDAPDQEFWLDETNRGSTIAPALANAYIWATAGHRVAFSEPYLMSHGNPYGKDGFPAHEVFRRMMLTLTYGAGPSIAVSQPGPLQRDVYHCLDEVRRRRPWLVDKSPEPWAALLVSDDTRNFYGRSPGLVEERYMASVLGAFRMLVEEHRPFHVVNDWDLSPEGLAKYKLLILPNAACLDDAQAAAVDGFVREGGGLIASLDASAFDQDGGPRAGFALAGVLGVEHRGAIAAGAATGPLDENFARGVGPDYWEKRKGTFDLRVAPGSFLDAPSLAGLIGDRPVTFKGPAVRVEVKAPAAEVAALMRPKDDATAPESPAVVSRSHGEGRVVYLAAGLDAAYYLYSYPYQRRLLRLAVDRVAPAPPPVAVAAPMCVHATVMRQSKAGERLVVHLFNDLDTTARHARPDDDVPLREETVPIRDVRVTFAPRYRLARVHLEPDGVDLKLEDGPDGAAVIVPRLDVHAMVVGELE